MMKGLLDLLFPPRLRCVLCRHEGEANVCQSCLADIQRFQPVVARLAAHGAVPHELLALLPYSGAVRKAIHRFKFGNTAPIASSLAVAFQRSAILPIDKIDLVTAVPMHRRRFVQRGYNQAELLAREIAALHDVPYAHTLMRTRPTPPQNTLGRAARVKNVEDAFLLERSLAGLRVLLVDDVFTTGSTWRACQKELYRAGAGHVALAVVAVSMSPHQIEKFN